MVVLLPQADFLPPCSLSAGSRHNEVEAGKGNENMSEDERLLRQYREQGSQAAFARLAARHLGFVYATCLRETQDAALAEESAQVVFLLLARKAPALRPDQSLSGWLFQTARFAARNAHRREARRKAWEEKAVEQAPSSGQVENALWDRISPAVNDALASLGAKDREAILLRFADGLSFPELGVALGTSEDAARMRLNRALDRLRRFIAKAGVPLSGVALAGLLADHTSQAAPAAFVAVLAGGGGLVSFHGRIEGYNLFNLMRASALVNRQSIRASEALRRPSQAATCSLTRSLLSMRSERHWRASTDSSISAMSSQLPCFGV